MRLSHSGHAGKAGGVAAAQDPHRHGLDLVFRMVAEQQVAASSVAACARQNVVAHDPRPLRQCWSALQGGQPSAGAPGCRGGKAYHGVRRLRRQDSGRRP